MAVTSGMLPPMFWNMARKLSIVCWKAPSTSCLAIPCEPEVSAAVWLMARKHLGTTSSQAFTDQAQTGDVAMSA